MNKNDDFCFMEWNPETKTYVKTWTQPELDFGATEEAPKKTKRKKHEPFNIKEIYEALFAKKEPVTFKDIQRYTGLENTSSVCQIIISLSLEYPIYEYESTKGIYQSL